jgi:zinc protease
MRLGLPLRLKPIGCATAVFDPKEVEAERTVILSERQGAENHPEFLLGEAVQSVAFLSASIPMECPRV